MKRLMLALLLLTLLTACSTVGNHIQDANFQQENQPIRSVSATVVYEGYTQEEVADAMNKASTLFEQSVGIKVETVEWRQTTWPDHNFDNILQTAWNVTGQYQRKTDWVICFYKKSIAEKTVHNLAFALLGVKAWEAGAEVESGQYIVSSRLDAPILAHEFAHLFGTGHSLLAPSGFALPFVPVEFHRNYVNGKERETILANKWKQFNGAIHTEDVVEAASTSQDTMRQAALR